MRHVITGGSGFVGRHLAAALLARGAEVAIFDLVAPAEAGLASAAFAEGDVRDGDALRRLNVGPDDVVYHLAARQFHLAVPRRNRRAWFAHVNVGGTRAVVEAMAAAGAHRLVFLSTDMVYGVPERSPIAADHPLRPLGPYGFSKRDAESILDSWRGRGFQITVLRPRMIAGPGRLGILSKLFALIDRGLPVPMIGRGRNRYQMVAVDDCVEAMLAAVDRGLPPGPYNLGSEDPPQVRALLRLLIRHAGSRSRPLPLPAVLAKGALGALDLLGLTLLHPEQYRIADAEYVLDTEPARRDLAWRPRRSDADMLLAAYDAHRHRGS